MSSIAFPPDETTTDSVRAHAQRTDYGQLTADTARAERNRRNASKSTGPRTPAGKRRSAQNARTHGLSSDPATLPPDLTQDPTFRLAKQELVDELRPTTPMQVFLVTQLAHLTWKLDQIPQLERRLLAAAPADPRNPEPGTSNASPADQANRLTALHLLQNEPTPLTRLWDHHRSLLTRAQSVLRQILQLQKHHRDRQDEDAALDARLDRNQRAERANAAERAAFDAMLRDMHADNQRKAEQARRHDHLSQTAPTRSNPHHSPAPAQNEPTPLAPLCLRASVPSVLSPNPAQPGATRRNKTQQLPPPAQKDNGQRDADTPALPQLPHPATIPELDP